MKKRLHWRLGEIMGKFSKCGRNTGHWRRHLDDYDMGKGSFLKTEVDVAKKN